MSQLLNSMTLFLQVVSWDEGKGTVDTHHEDGRSYISAVSEVLYDAALSCDGEPKVPPAAI